MQLCGLNTVSVQVATCKSLESWSKQEKGELQHWKAYFSFYLPQLTALPLYKEPNKSDWAALLSAEGLLLEGSTKLGCPSQGLALSLSNPAPNSRRDLFSRLCHQVSSCLVDCGVGISAVMLLSVLPGAPWMLSVMLSAVLAVSWLCNCQSCHLLGAGQGTFCTGFLWPVGTARGRRYHKPGRCDEVWSCCLAGEGRPPSTRPAPGRAPGRSACDIDRHAESLSGPRRYVAGHEQPVFWYGPYSALENPAR